MSKYFDTITKGFYEENAQNRIQLTDDEWSALLKKQALGGQIKAVGGKVFCVLENEEVQNGAIVDVSSSEEYKTRKATKEKELKTSQLQSQIDSLDMKCIRALREGGVKDSSTGQTWLEYYTKQIVDLRTQIAAL